MFEIRVEGVEELLAKFAKYDAQINALHHAVPDELTAWQREDMKRKYPNTQSETANNETRATTLVWPRSRQPSKDRTRRGPKLHLPAQRGPRILSHRPILRASLIVQLYDRMRNLVAEAMKWP